MLTKTTLTAAVLFAVSTSAAAQKYKCTDANGKTTYSQTQCAVDAAKMEAKTGGGTKVASRKATEEEKNACLDAIRYGYKDPKSLTTEGIVAHTTYGDGHAEINMMVNAKNSYGGFVGAKPAFCKIDVRGAITSTNVY